MNQQVKSEKTCKVCGEIKSLSDFHRAGENKDGHSSLCKVCKSERASLYYKSNKEARAAYQKKYNKTNESAIKANRVKTYARQNELKRAAYKANPKPHKDRQKIYVKNNRDKVFNRQEEYRKIHQNEIKVRNNAIKARYSNTIHPAYVAVVLRMPRSEIPDEIIALKQEQLLIHRLSRQLKKASNETRQDTDRIPGKPGASGNARRSAEDRRQQPVGTGTQGDQCNRRRSPGEGTGLDQQQSERRDKSSKDEC